MRKKYGKFYAGWTNKTGHRRINMSPDVFRRSMSRGEIAVQIKIVAAVKIPIAGAPHF